MDDLFETVKGSKAFHLFLRTKYKEEGIQPGESFSGFIERHKSEWLSLSKKEQFRYRILKQEEGKRKGPAAPIPMEQTLRTRDRQRKYKERVKRELEKIGISQKQLKYYIQNPLLSEQLMYIEPVEATESTQYTSTSMGNES